MLPIQKGGDEHDSSEGDCGDTTQVGPEKVDQATGQGIDNDEAELAGEGDAATAAAAAQCEEEHDQAKTAGNSDAETHAEKDPEAAGSEGDKQKHQAPEGECDEAGREANNDDGDEPTIPPNDEQGQLSPWKMQLRQRILQLKHPNLQRIAIAFSVRKKA